MIFDKATYVARQGNADNYADETDNDLVKIGVDKHLTPQLYGRILPNVNIDFQKMKNNRVYYNFARSKAKSLYYNDAQKTIPNYKKKRIRTAILKTKTKI